MSPSQNPVTPAERRKRPTAALIVASLALVVAAAPPAYAALAANSVGSKQIKNHSVSYSDLKGGAVTSGIIRNGSIAVGDLGSSARWRRTMTGSWDNTEGAVKSVAAYPATTAMGGLGSGGTGLLKLARSPRVLVDGSVLAQNASGATRKIDCNVVIDGTTAYPNVQALVLTGSSTTLAVSASKTLDPGTYDVSVNCTATSMGITAGNVHVNVVAVPLY